MIKMYKYCTFDLKCFAQRYMLYMIEIIICPKTYKLFFSQYREILFCGKCL